MMCFFINRFGFEMFKNVTPRFLLGNSVSKSILFSQQLQEWLIAIFYSNWVT